MTDTPHAPENDDERREPAGDEHGEPTGAEPREPTGDAPAAVPPTPEPRRLTRSTSDRLVGGVAGGLARHLGADPLAVRIGFVLLTFFGGFGVIAYLAGLVLIPNEGDEGPQRWGLARTVGAGLLAAAAIGVFVPNWLWGPELPVLAVTGVVIYLLVRTVRDDGGSRLGHVAARIALGIALVSLAAAGFTAAAAGSALGGGILIAGLVIALGVALVGGAFRGGARWLIVPAFVLALPLGVVSAADLDLEGDWGERTFRPVTAARAADGFQMGVGHMQLDLRAIDFPAGRTVVPVELGVGEIEVAVPPGVCVTYDIQAGAGDVRTLDGIDDGGVDLDVDGDAIVPAGTPELHVRARVGLGAVRIWPEFLDGGFDRGPRFERGLDLDRGVVDLSGLNRACEVAS